LGRSPACLAGRPTIRSEQVGPPDGVRWTDWEGVLATRRAEATCPIEELRQLGPEVEPNHVLLTVDEVLTRKPEAGHFLELARPGS
jgi:hypothetical protein